MTAPLTLVGAALLVPALLVGQTTSSPRPPREGLWFNLGMGYGSLGCFDCEGREGGLSGGLGLGGTVSRTAMLGVFSNGWSKSESGVTLTVGSLVAGVRWYPSSTGGFFFLGGLGIGVVRVDLSGFGHETQTGAAALLGLGYDIRLGASVSVTPFWNGVGIKHDNGDANFGQIGLGITIH